MMSWDYSRKDDTRLHQIKDDIINHLAELFWKIIKTQAFWGRGGIYHPASISWVDPWEDDRLVHKLKRTLSIT